jgi:hypothetical protein
MTIDRAQIHSVGTRVFFQPFGNCSMNYDLTAQELQSAIDNDLIFRHLDSKPDHDIYVFRASGRRLLRSLKTRFLGY